MKFFAVFALLIVGSLATDYCNKELCKQWNGASYDYVPHIGCNNPGNFAAICTEASAFDGFDYRVQILDKINSLRNAFASGTDGFPAALRAREVTWNRELAALALLNVRQCKMEHDQCHNTDQFPYSGQNLGWSGTDDTVDVVQAIDSAIQRWYNEKVNCTQDVLDKYYSKPGPVTGHFTALVCDRQTEVGCAYALYRDVAKGYNAFLLACNLASTNMIGSPIYKTSDKPGSGCTNMSGKYPSLCDANEPIDANNFGFSEYEY